MRPFSTIAARHPFTVALAVLALFVVWFTLPLVLAGPVDVTGGTGAIAMDDLGPYIVTEGIVATALLVLIAVLGWLRTTGLRGPSDPAGWRMSGWFIGPATIAVGLSWGALVALGSSTPLLRPLVQIVALALLIGLFEEGLFRGVLLHGLRSRISTGWAIVASSVLFGLFHVVNAFVGQDIGLTIIQIASSTGLGLLFGALTVQAGSVWPAVILHALWNGFALSAQMAFRLSPGSDAMAPPTPGLAALVLPALLAVAAYVVHRRWTRRMTTAGTRPVRMI
ncbi:CAAX protease self-immunity [Loktanella fryxellensis]|uniref:CAAX protease self-immunity n=1 Tax=Loktanella fryxellensis TaxID=245187 RepID=A0A1H8F769_9RHOB|nr:type II CAAX endopeptidase family protein [Loktanella fryxellensis]SEN27336.1 CAAX protease self-immunity [Loktanella fryxellensis]